MPQSALSVAARLSSSVSSNDPTRSSSTALLTTGWITKPAFWTAVCLGSLSLSACNLDIEGDRPGECADGLDDDSDGLTDCDDPNCFGSPVCDGDDNEPGNTDARVQESEHVPCIVSQDGVGGYVDGLASSGITFEAFTAWGGFGSDGVVLNDLDNDGCPDLILTQPDGDGELYWNTCNGDGSAGFEPASGSTEGLFLGDMQGNPAVGAADVDGDGWQDVVLTSGHQSVRLMRNLGNRTFSDVTSQFGLNSANAYSAGISWGDMDLDGDLDMFILRQGGTEEEWQAGVSDHLFRNEAGQALTQVTGRGIGELLGASNHTAWFDLDRDGDQDFFEFNDDGNIHPSRFWENLGVDDTGNVVWDERKPDTGMGMLLGPMGVVINDLNQDGLPDIWLSDVGQNRVFENVGGPRDDGSYEWAFVDVGQGNWVDAAEHRNGDISWSVLRVDIEGDGQPEIFVTFGFTFGFDYFGSGDLSDIPQPDRVFVNRNNPGEAPFFQSDEDLIPVAPSNGTGAAMADINRDGVADIVVHNYLGAPDVYLGKCTETSRLVVALQDDRSLNPFGIGARVQVEVDGMVQTQQMDAGGTGSFGTSEPELFYGLGDAERVDRIDIWWPDAERSHSTLFDVCANCRVQIRHDGGGDGSR